MKIKIELVESSIEEEVIIRCNSLSENVLAVQKAASEVIAGRQRFALYHGDTEYYLPLQDVLFFETDQREINAHTVDNVYQTKYKLYELEQLLPSYFLRVSKSSILNLNQVFSVTHNLSSCLVEFQNTHKQVYVSRYYYKLLKARLEEKRVNE